jgi:hypothetical protein
VFVSHRATSCSSVGALAEPAKVLKSNNVDAAPTVKPPSKPNKARPFLSPWICGNGTAIKTITGKRPLPSWILMRVDEIYDIRLLDRTFPGGRPTSSGNHIKWDKLFIRVKPADDHSLMTNIEAPFESKVKRVGGSNQSR